MMSSPSEEIGATLAETGRRCGKAGSRRRPPLVPAAAPEAVEIGRQDRLDRGRRDAEARQGSRRPGETTLSRFRSSTWSGVSGGFGRIDISLACSSATPKGRSMNQRLRRISCEQQLEQLAEGVDLRPAELVGAPGGRRIVEAFDHRIGDIADIDRLEAGLAAADQRQHRRDHRHRGKAVEELVFRAEHHRRAAGSSRSGRHRAPPASPAALVRA